LLTKLSSTHIWKIKAPNQNELYTKSYLPILENQTIILKHRTSAVNNQHTFCCKGGNERSDGDLDFALLSFFDELFPKDDLLSGAEETRDGVLPESTETTIALRNMVHHAHA